MTSDRSTGDRLLIGVALAVLATLLVALGVLILVRDLHSGASTALASPPASAAGVPSLGPSASPLAAAATPGAAASSAASAAPSASAGSSLADEIATIEAQVPPIRQLQPAANVPNRIVDEATAAADLQREYDQSNPTAMVTAVQDLWERLGLLSPGTDLRALELQAQQSQVIGYYDDTTRTMTVVQQGATFGPLDEMTVAHEYTHALQDQHFGLASLKLDTPDQTDRDLARQALAEGDATVTMTAWAIAHLTPTQLQQVANSAGLPESQAELAKLPPVLQRLIAFPYQDGATFVGQLLQQPGQWSAVDAAFKRPPDSTAQILHPQLYLSRQEPVQVKLPGVPSALGSGWRASMTDTLGELITQIWLAQGVDGASAIKVAAGWAGDRIGSYDGPGGAWGVVWSTAWQNQADARAFESPAAQVIQRLATGGTVAAVRRLPTLAGPGGNREAVLIASNQATLTRLERLVGG